MAGPAVVGHLEVEVLVDVAVAGEAELLVERRPVQVHVAVVGAGGVAADRLHERIDDRLRAELVGGLLWRLDALLVAAVLQLLAEVPGRVVQLHLLHALQLHEHLVGLAQAATETRQWCVEHHDHRDLFTDGAELLGHLVGRDAAAGEAAEEVRTLGLHAADLLEVRGRHVLEAGVRLLFVAQALGLDAVDGTVGTDEHRQVTQVQDVAEHARHEEERLGAGSRVG